MTALRFATPRGDKGCNRCAIDAWRGAQAIAEQSEQQVARDGEPVLRRRAHVVDRRDVVSDERAGLAHDLARQALALHERLGASQPPHRGRHAPERKAQLLDACRRAAAREARRDGLRDRLGRARADLAEHLRASAAAPAAGSAPTRSSSPGREAGALGPREERRANGISRRPPAETTADRRPRRPRAAGTCRRRGRRSRCCRRACRGSGSARRRPWRRPRRAAASGVARAGARSSSVCVASAPTTQRVLASPGSGPTRASGDRSRKVRPASAPAFHATMRSVPPAIGSASRCCGEEPQRLGAASAAAAASPPRRRPSRLRLRLRARPSAPRSRCAGSRCSGTGCPRARGGSRSRRGARRSRGRPRPSSACPGVQIPHCAAPSVEERLPGAGRGAPGRPSDSTVATRRPAACADGTRQLTTACAVEQHRAGAALAFAAAFLGAGQREVLAQHVEQALHARARERAALAVDGEARPSRRGVLARAPRAIRSGVIGSASTKRPMRVPTAAATAGAGMSIGSSPTPFAPKGPSEYGAGTKPRPSAACRAPSGSCSR